MDGRLIFPFPSIKSGIFMDEEQQSEAALSGASAKLRQDCQNSDLSASREKWKRVYISKAQP